MGDTLSAIVIVCATAAAGCAASSSFVLTGSDRAARSEEAPIKPYLTGPPQGSYQEIGVVEVRGFKLADRVERAAAVAREHGGNAIILLSSNVRVESNPATAGGGVWAPGPYGWGGWGGWGPGAPAASVQSYEVDRYVVVWVDDLD